MLSANHNRTSVNDPHRISGDQSNISTKYGGSNARMDYDNQTQISEIESRFTRKRKNHKQALVSKLYKDEDSMEIYQDDDTYNPGEGNFKHRTKKEEIR